MSDESELEYEGAEGETASKETTGAATAPPAAGGTGLPLREGAVVGAGAFLLNYAVVFAMTSIEYTASLGGASTTVSSWKVAVWSMLGSLGVGIELDGDPATLSGISQTASQADAAMTYVGPNVFTYLISIGIMVAAGYTLAKHTDGDRLEDSLKASVMAVPGFLVLALVLSFFASHSFDVAQDSVSVGLVTSDAVLYAGVVFPAVFGLVGGLLATWPKPVDRALEIVE